MKMWFNMKAEEKKGAKFFFWLLFRKVDRIESVNARTHKPCSSTNAERTLGTLDDNNNCIACVCVPNPNDSEREINAIKYQCTRFARLLRLSLSLLFHPYELAEYWGARKGPVLWQSSRRTK